eukprot:NODE_104_length_19952_cov_0.449000.p12 type:complete len:204 gc:universal NODE_104_length_19952_cov_0.449000:4610-3999(-)
MEALKKLGDFMGEIDSNALEICIDLDFDKYMSHKELKSLIDQVRYCYSYNRKLKNPCKLLVMGCSPKSWKMLKTRDAKMWNIKYIELYKQPIEEVLENVVYLTADATETLESLDLSTTYVVGGIVDKNRHKNLCLEKANSLGMRTARLPLNENVNLSMSSVLTVNQVVEILLQFYNTGNWEFLNKSIPQRRQREVKNEDVSKE